MTEPHKQDERIPLDGDGEPVTINDGENHAEGVSRHYLWEGSEFDYLEIVSVTHKFKVPIAVMKDKAVGIRLKLTIVPPQR